MEKKTGWQKFAYFFVIGFIAGVLVVVMVQNMKKSVAEGEVEENISNQTETSSSVSVEDQNAGNTVLVSSVSVPKISWIAVRENNNDVMGRILGAKKLQVGDQEDVIIELLRPTTPYVMYAIVFYEDDGDGVFDHEQDIAVKNSEDSEIFARFSVN